MKYIIKENKKNADCTCLYCKKNLQKFMLLSNFSTAKTNTAESCYYGFEVMFSDLLIVHQTTYMLALDQAVSLL